MVSHQEVLWVLQHSFISSCLCCVTLSAGIDPVPVVTGRQSPVEGSHWGHERVEWATASPASLFPPVGRKALKFKTPMKQSLTSITALHLRSPERRLICGDVSLRTPGLLTDSVCMCVNPEAYSVKYLYSSQIPSFQQSNFTHPILYLIFECR